MMQSNYSDIMKNRELFYGFLARMYEKELSPGLLDQLKNIDYPEDCGQAEMRDGYRLLKAGFQEKSPNTAEDFAVDYARVFLSAGESNGKAAFPYESAYTSKTGLVMQEAWAEVKDIYAAKGLGLSTSMSDLKEDHIAVEMLYMARLCQKFPDDNDQSGLDEQLEFLNRHLLNWVPAFCADVEKYARTDFYKGLSKLTLGYLKYDQEILGSLAAENKTPEIRSYTLSQAEMDQVFNKLKERYKIYAPKFLEKRGPKGQDIVRYQEVASVGEIVYDQPSAFSAKEVYYPIMQTMFHFGEDSYAESEIDAGKDLLIFLRPCDINALRRLDAIFLENGGRVDVYYARLRDRVKIVLMECGQSYENCFCASMGSNTTDNYSLALRMSKDGVKIQVKDKAFQPYFVGREGCAFKPEFISANAGKALLPVIEDNETLALASNLEYWKQFDDQCIGCGGCNTVCPTCSCFDTIDVIYDESSREGERRRVWSSCMLDSFTMTAGGGRARKTPGSNMRFKALHKVYDYRTRFGTGDNMCVGCGRCIGQCPREISFLKTINQFSEELQTAKKRTGGQ